jgi:hypothetical protein
MISFLFTSRLRFFILGVAAVMLFALQGQAQQAPLGAGVDPSRRVEDGTFLPTATLSDDLNLGHRSFEEDNAFAPASHGDDDIGQQLILKETPKDQPFRFQAESFLFWTNNAAHASRGAIDDAFWGWHVASEWQPQITNKLFGEVGISQDWFRYDTLQELDFETFEATAGLYYLEPRLADSLFFLQYQYQYLTHNYHSLLNTHAARAGVQKVIVIDRRNSIQVCLMGVWDFYTDVPLIKRNEYSGDVAWRYKLTHDLMFSLGYHFTCFDYDAASRVDCLNAVSFNISYTPRPWLEIYAGYSYSFNNSNLAPFSYEAANAGGGVGVRLKF